MHIQFTHTHTHTHIHAHSKVKEMALKSVKDIQPHYKKNVNQNYTEVPFSTYQINYQDRDT